MFEQESISNGTLAAGMVLQAKLCGEMGFKYSFISSERVPGAWPPAPSRLRLERSHWYIKGRGEDLPLTPRRPWAEEEGQAKGQGDADAQALIVSPASQALGYKQLQKYLEMCSKADGSGVYVPLAAYGSRLPACTRLGVTPSKRMQQHHGGEYREERDSPKRYSWHPEGSTWV